MDEPILVARNGHTATVTLNRPEKRNAVDAAARILLDEAMAGLDADPEIRVVVLTGAGTAFCAGTDLAGAAPTAAPGRRLVAALDEFSKPLIAAVNGAAVGGGFELALAADLRVATPAAKFALPELRLGSLPGSGGTQRIFTALPSAIAWKTLYTGEFLSAEDALRYGLVSDVFPAESFAADVQALAARVAEAAPLSLRAAKRAGRAAIEDPAGHELERTLFGELAETADRAEGRAAFREKRPPRFEGR
jgi:enoyl-CoA hydratase/carnithine racemase